MVKNLLSGYVPIIVVNCADVHEDTFDIFKFAEYASENLLPAERLWV